MFDRQQIRNTLRAAVSLAALAASSVPAMAETGIFHDFSELSIQDQTLISHGNRILGANDIMRVDARNTDISRALRRIGARMDAVLDEAGPNVAMIAEGFREVGREQALSGSWDPDRLGDYAIRLSDIQIRMEGGKLQDMLMENIALSGIAPEYSAAFAEEIVSIHFNGHARAEETRVISFTSDKSPNTIRIPEGYAVLVAEVREMNSGMIGLYGQMPIAGIAALATSAPPMVAYEIPTRAQIDAADPAPEAAASAPPEKAAAAPEPAAVKPEEPGHAALVPPAPPADLTGMSPQDMSMLAHGMRLLGADEVLDIGAQNTDARRNMKRISERTEAILANAPAGAAEVAAEFREAGRLAAESGAISLRDFGRYATALSKSDRMMEDGKVQGMVIPPLVKAGLSPAGAAVAADEMLFGHLAGQGSLKSGDWETAAADGTVIRIEIPERYLDTIGDLRDLDARMEEAGAGIDAIAVTLQAERDPEPDVIASAPTP